MPSCIALAFAFCSPSIGASHVLPPVVLPSCPPLEFHRPYLISHSAPLHQQANTGSGIKLLSNATDCTIGGEGGDEVVTVLSGNAKHGIECEAPGLRVLRAHIGLDAGGRKFQSNLRYGVLLHSNAIKVRGFW